MRKQIVLVGHTDTCALPLCAAMLRCMCQKKGMHSVTIKTCGFWAVNQRSPEAELLIAAGEMGIDLSDHRSTYIREDLLQSADWIIPQDDMIARGLREYLNRDTEKVLKPIKVNSPNPTSLDRCRYMRQELYAYCQRLMRKLSDLQRSQAKFMSQVEYKPVLPSQVDQVLALEEICFSHPWSRQALISELEKGDGGYFVGAFYEDRLLGYGSLYTAHKTAYVNNIAVDPQFRGMGIGEEIVEKLEQHSWAIGMEELSLEVRSQNQIAINLYEKRGFESCGTRPGFYRDPPDAGVIMTKKTRT